MNKLKKKKRNRGLESCIPKITKKYILYRLVNRYPCLRNAFTFSLIDYFPLTISPNLIDIILVLFIVHHYHKNMNFPLCKIVFDEFVD